MKTKRRRKVADSRNTRFLGSAEGIFHGPDHLFHGIDSLLAFIHQRYAHERSPSPRLFGFIITQMGIQRDSSVVEVEVRSEYARGRAMILAPIVRGETPSQWEDRKNRLLTTFWPTLQEAQIRATIQLYQALSPEGQKKLLESRSPR